jgi:hypothetical protein
VAAAWLTRLSEAASPATLPPGAPAPQLDIAAALAAARLRVLGELTDEE